MDWKKEKKPRRKSERSLIVVPVRFSLKSRHLQASERRPRKSSDLAWTSGKFEPLTLGGRGAEEIGATVFENELRGGLPGDMDLDAFGQGGNSVTHAELVSLVVATASRHVVEKFFSEIKDSILEDELLYDFDMRF